MWTKEEKKFLRSLKTPHHIQCYLDEMIPNKADTVASPRISMQTNTAHCLEGSFLSAVALELQGHKPLMVNLVAEDDDYHAITVYKSTSGWGCLSKSNYTLLRGRSPVYQSVRELVMSYYDFYINDKGKLSLYSYSNPINLNKYNSWNWRTTDKDLVELGMHFSTLPHYEVVSLRDLRKRPAVSERLQEVYFYGRKRPNN